MLLYTLSFVAILAAMGTTPNDSYRRIYQAGDSYQYEIQMAEIVDNQLVTKADGISEHHVVQGAFPAERVSWQYLKVTKNATSKDLTEDVKKVPPYLVSLDARGSIQLPERTSESVSGPILDLNMVFASVSPAIGVGQLKKLGDSFRHPYLHQGQWNNDVIEVGEDCMTSVISASRWDEAELDFITTFEAPRQRCLNLKVPYMEVPVVDGKLNNFQQVRLRDGKREVMWGLENINVQTTVDRASGKIIHAMMVNSLELKAKSGCNAELTQCESERPLKIQRSFTINLKDQP